MKKPIIITVISALAASMAYAQRTTDVLDRGLVAVPNANGILCTWRIPAEEWYGVKYNIYRDGTKLNAEPLDVSNYVDANGSATSKYAVAAVVDGVEQSKSSAITPWEKNYTIIKPKHDASLKSTFVPNDATCADVDGDGELEILMKYDNASSVGDYYHDGYNGEFTIIECLKLDGTLLWWIDFGPNIGDFQNNEINIMAYDWDRDGKAEVVFRAADGTTIHQADGTQYVIGDKTLNYRATTQPDGQWFMCQGREYLIYADGLTGKPYQNIEYPLKRVEDADNPKGLIAGSEYLSLVNSAWGDGYGHRSSKYMHGAPYLDGHNPSIFLARGIYTQHKMIAYDVDPATHELIERWRWNSIGGSWHGQGYHNYSIADVDWDGRDEIVYGSMVIDDNGYGLSTTGLGHGDSHHVGDFDPYSHGQEVFACNEDQPNNNFRDATTSKIYYRTTGGNDDGRANCGKFIDEYPGAQAISSRDDNLIGCASHKGIIGDSKGTVKITQNFRIYWDGDLCDESFDYSNGKNSAGAIFKAREGQIALLEGSKTNNDTKGTPCYQGDVLGDWREEVIMRDGDNNIRIYTTDLSTPWRIYTLWHDPQYRQAMVWQMCGYNQTPHVSFYLGEFEGITVPPAPITMTGREEVKNNGTISVALNSKHVVIRETDNINVVVAEGVSPKILTVNTPSWVQGNNSNKATREYYTHSLTGGALAGSMQLVKQGDGILELPNATHTYTGKTEVWGGQLTLNGTLANSPLWINRFAALNTAGGKFMKGIELNYGATINIGSDEAASSLETTNLDFGFGSFISFDLFGADLSADVIKAAELNIEKKDWINGPERLAPTFLFVGHTSDENSTLQSGKYLIGEIKAIEGNLSDIILSGLDGVKKVLVYEDGKLYVEISTYETAVKTWLGTEGAWWDLDNSLAFVTADSSENVGFAPGDEVIFNDNAQSTEVNIVGNLSPSKVTFDNEVDYVLQGEGSIIGEASLVKNGNGKLTITNVNQFTGNVYVNGGTLAVNSFANSIGTDYGALGGVSNRIYLSNKAVLSALASTTCGQRITINGNHGTIDTPSGVTLTLSYGVNNTTPGQTLYKTGAGTLALASGNSLTKLVIEGGTVNAAENSSSVMQLPSTVEFVNGTLRDECNISSYSTNNANFVVEAGNKGTLYLDARCEYNGKLTGAGTFSVYATSVRNYLNGDWSGFEGTVNAGLSKVGSYDPQFLWNNAYGMPKATLNISSGTTFDAQSNSVAIGSLSGSGTMKTSATITVGGNDKTFAFTGSYSGNPAIVKVGAGEWKLASALSDVRSVTVKGGYVSLSPKAVTTQVFTQTVTLQDSAIMRGRAVVANLVVNQGAILEPGYYTTSNNVHYGTIESTGDVTINPGATLSLSIRSASGNNTHSYLTVAGNLNINGKVSLDLYTGYIPAVGDELSLWTCKTFAGKPEILLPELPDGMGWDTTDLCTEKGLIRIVESAGINDIAMDEDVTCRVYSLSGIFCGEVEATPSTVGNVIRQTLSLPAGTYIVTMANANQTATIKIQL